MYDYGSEIKEDVESSPTIIGAVAFIDNIFGMCARALFGVPAHPPLRACTI
jgi:hypothetical protein